MWRFSGDSSLPCLLIVTIARQSVTRKCSCHRLTADAVSLSVTSLFRSQQEKGNKVREECPEGGRYHLILKVLYFYSRTGVCDRLTGVLDCHSSSQNLTSGRGRERNELLLIAYPWRQAISLDTERFYTFLHKLGFVTARLTSVLNCHSNAEHSTPGRDRERN